MLRKLTAIFFISATSASSQDWNVRNTDKLLSQDEASEQLVGKVITFFDNGESQFFEDGRYRYTYDGGGSAHGYYQVKADGVVCVEYVHGFERCDRFVRAGDRLVLLTENGERFPVRPQ